MAAKQSNRSRKTKRPTKAVIIAVVALVLAIAIALVVIYFAAPDTWNMLVDYLVQDNGTPDNTTNNGGGQSGTLTQGEGDLLVDILDVGQGDCIYIRFPDGKEMIIDCGNKSSGYDFNTTKDYLNARVSDNQIDYLMLTHGDEDHVEFLDNILDMYDVDNVYMPNIKAVSTKETYQTQLAALDADKLAMFDDPDTISTDMYAQFFIAALTEVDCNVYLNEDTDNSTNNIVINDAANTYSLTFFCPTSDYYESSNLSSAERKNAVSPIGILEYNGKRIVLTGDSNEINEPTFVSRAKEKFGGITLDCDVLKVGHHGSETSSTTEFLGYIQCENAVISCKAAGNTYYHPRQTTLDRMTALSMNVYRTDLQGNVVLKVDKDGVLSITTDRQATSAQLFDGWTAEEIEEDKAA